MNWRKVIIGAISAIFVSIVSGVTVFYLTKEDKSRQPLSYSIEQTATFDGREGALRIFTINITNSADQPLESLEATISVPAGAGIADFNVQSGIGHRPDIVARSEGEVLNISLPFITQNENLRVIIFVRGAAQLQPTAFIRTSKAVAVKKENLAASDRNLVLKIFRGEGSPIAISFTIFLLMSLTMLLALAISKLANIIYARASDDLYALNNTAFVILHAGLFEDAKRILEIQLDQKGGNALVVSNYGLVLALLGDAERSERMLLAGSWWASSDHEQAVVLFNKSICSHLFGRQIEAVEAIRTALKLSRKEILRYSDYSIYVKKVVEENSGFSNALAEAKKDQQQKTG